MRIVGRCEVLQAFVGRLVGSVGYAQVEGNTAKQPLMFDDMFPADIKVGFTGNSAQVLHDPRFRIAADVLGVYEICGGGNQERYDVRLADD